MLAFIIFLFCMITALGLSVLAAWQDFKGYRIPNLYPLLIGCAFIFAYVLLWILGVEEIVFYSLTSHGLSAIIVFAITALMFTFKLLGAGDSKFATVIALWGGLPGFTPFLFYMTFAGGLLAIASLLLRKYKPFSSPLEGSWLDKAQQGSNHVPYGIAICVGAFVSFYFSGYVSLEKWMQLINT